MTEGPLSSRSRSVGEIASAAGVVGIATLLSRILGFVRDMAIAWLFGAGMVADAFFVAFRIPSTLRELLGEGALSAAFIPAFTRTAARDGKDAAWALASKVMGSLAVVLALVTALGILLAPWIVQALAPGFAGTPGKLALTSTLLRIMFPYIFLVGLTALFMAILNSLGHFLAPALSPTVLNLVIIAVAILVAPASENPVVPIAGAVVLGGLGQLFIQVPAAVARGWRARLHVAPTDPAVREIGRLMLPGVAGLAVTQINVFVGTLLASLLPEGSVAAMTYAFRLVQFPIGVVGVAIATGALPVMAAAMARDAVGDMKRALQDSLRLAIFLGLPAMVGLIVFRVPIVGLLFERGAFGRPVTLLTAAILAAYAVGLAFYIANRILAPAFYAMKDTWSPVATGMVAVFVNIVASLILMRPLGAVGLALATAVASASNCLQLALRLRRRVGLLGGRAILRAAGRVALACVPMALWGLGSQVWWDVMAVPSVPERVLVLVLQLGVSAVLFVGSARILRCDEFGWAWDLVRRRIGRASER
ncbi:MAG: murein biosynthesis integral membrane protein MurJ [Zetaproteobacteria bacterium]|nr:MAG: murein biosynthesis integral membrane protein MurJ [Zetaproteobacteria bacterium]